MKKLNVCRKGKLVKRRKFIKCSSINPFYHLIKGSIKKSSKPLKKYTVTSDTEIGGIKMLVGDAYTIEGVYER